MPARKLTVGILPCLCVLVGVLSLIPGAAQAATTRDLLRTFGCATGPNCTVPAPAGSTLSKPQGEAVLTSGPEAGDVYVADTGNNRMEKFGPNGEFLLTFGANVGGPAIDTCTALCSPGTKGSAPGEFENAQFVAIDPTIGDVYVADTADNLVSKFSSAGVLEKTWGVGGQLSGGCEKPGESTPCSGSKVVPFGSIAGIAVGSAGVLYVLNESNTVFEFAADSTFLEERGLGFATLPRGLGVNPVGDLFRVPSSERVREDTPTESLLLTEETNVGTFTLDANGELYTAGTDGSLGHFAFNGKGKVIEPGGGECAELCAATDSVPVGFVGTGIAALPGGEVFLSNAGEGKVYEYGPPLPIPDVSTEEATEVTATSVRVNGKVKPDGAQLKGCAFEYIEEARYEPSIKDPYTGGGTAACVPAAGSIPTGAGEETEVHADITGLTPGATYHFRLIAFNENDESKPTTGEGKTFATLPPPSFDEATVTDLTLEAATLNAKINPRGSETHYHFEYDTTPYAEGEGPHGVATAEATIPAGASDVFVSAPIALKEANTQYYWRVVATNANATGTSADHTFIYDTTGAELPDGRAYELVSPSHKNGAFLAVFEQPPRIAPDGERVMAEAIQCFDSSGSCTADRGGISASSPYSFTRTPAGWVTQSLAPSAAQFETADVWDFDASSGDVLLSMPTPAGLGGNGEDDFYVREEAGLAHMGPVTPPAKGALGPKGGISGGEKQAATADYSHFVWEAPEEVALEPGTGEKTTYEYSRPEGGLLGSGGAQPLLVGVSGGEGSKSLISSCRTELGGIGGSNLQPYPGSTSEDGRTVFFTALGGSLHTPLQTLECFGTGDNAGVHLPADEVFARVDGELRPDEARGLGVAEARTVAISEPSEKEVEGRETVVAAAPYSGCEKEPCIKNVNEPGNFANAEFVGASADGSKAFFLSPQQLTDEASEDSNKDAVVIEPGEEHRCHLSGEAGGCNLYLFDAGAPEGKELVDVSRGDSSGEGPRVQGVMALSPDGSHVYFVAKGILTSAPNGRGLLARDGAENLYMFERDSAFPAGRTVFIADLVPGEPGVGDEREWEQQPGEPVNVSPDGRFLVFLSRGDLTADDTSASGASQVFEYNAGSGGAGSLTRVSIGNNGFNDNGNRSAPGVCPFGKPCEEDAAIVPVTETFAERPDPSMSDDGSRVFFESPVGLAPGAVDDVRAGEVNGNVVLAQNVYEWEREGVGSCPAGRAAGCVFLISDGQDVSHQETDYGQLCTERVALCLMGTDSEGKNVFFATADSLVKADTNTEVDFYDARICEPERGNPCIAEPPPPLPPCAGEDCHGIPAGLPGVPAAPTVTFNGAGNLTSTPAVTKLTKKTVKCHKGFVKKKVKKKEQCVKRKSKKQAKKSSKSRHGGKS